jgi:ubiquinone/menaquinone biosynthesis C-methylase UbiE
MRVKCERMGERVTDSPTASDQEYVLGHSNSELERLREQGTIFEEATLSALRAAGLSPGMHVLDLGCGVGDVSLLAASLVGPTGSVLGVDQADVALGYARGRAASSGHHNVTFMQADVEALHPVQPPDAIIGRFILLYIPERAALLRRLAKLLRPGGVLAFCEMDVGSAQCSAPMPLFEEGLGWVESVYRRAGIEPNMGSMLHRTFREAGLSPRLTAQAVVEGGKDSRIFRYFSETLRSLAPSIVESGIADMDKVKPDSFGDRLRDQADDNVCFFFPRLVSAWAIA